MSHQQIIDAIEFDLDKIVQSVLDNHRTPWYSIYNAKTGNVTHNHVDGFKPNSEEWIFPLGRFDMLKKKDITHLVVLDEMKHMINNRQHGVFSPIDKIVHGYFQ